MVEGADIVTVTAKGALNVDQRYDMGASSIKSAIFMVGLWTTSNGFDKRQS